MRKSLLAAAAVGAGALASRRHARSGDPLPPPLPGDQRVEHWRGFDVSYTVDGEGPDTLLLHGVHAAGSAQEFGGVFEGLAADRRVVAPDLPGFGCSSRPSATYTAALYEEFVADFADRTTENAACVATSLSGAYAAAAAVAAESDRFSRLVLVCPTADTGPRRPGLRAALRAPVVGTALFNALTARPALSRFDARDAYAGGADTRTVDYQWRTTHRPGARFAPASFVGGYLDPDRDLGATLASLDAPVTLVWGTEADRPPLSAGRDLAERAGARLVTVDPARLLPHAEHPEAFLDAVDL
jgi:pimeloyl-ACP methyl ester carboxylesterase